ncbi:WHG domain-containing protein [Phycicoccus endophyticus]|uniref:WHG domain-containing protein n=1 Tax=Phycicoccus endophyticus TaxID=1690220 RepID=A0A7G9R0X5_9MICO|nr:TetR/AcrR family transcriptional regulator [Phycicoccus endophyticus]NHI19544.1 TetR/AcrR family transcriptional regulator [Phycicoccus endophyticus]QNN49250.1 WHG domain-containing protein [Phycicoccus endophyticus]
MPPTTRAERRRDLERRIVEVGRRHLVTQGAAGLSLRAVTRELGMVSSAVYRYVANRDELLTLLVVDAYTELADRVDAALDAAAAQRWDERVVTAGLAFRAWAAGDPASYALLYGSPVPGYEAPAERTVEPGTRVVLALARLVAEGSAAGEVARSGPVPVSGAALSADLERLAVGAGLAEDGEDVVGRALFLWSSLVGATSLEVFGQYGTDAVLSPADLLEHELRLALTVVRGR